MHLINAVKYLPSTVNNKFLELQQKFPNLVLSGFSNISAKAFLISDFIRNSKNNAPLLWVVNDSTEKENYKRILNFWTDTNVIDFSIQENTLNNRAISQFNNGKITQVIAKLLEPKKQIILTTYKDLLTFVPQKEELLDSTWFVNKLDQLSLVQIFEKLIDMGFTTADSPFVEEGEYYCKGNIITVKPYNTDYTVRITVDFDEITELDFIDPEQKEVITSLDTLAIFPVLAPKQNQFLTQYLSDQNQVVFDELEVIDEDLPAWEVLENNIQESSKISFQIFHEDEPNHYNAQYVSTLKYYTIQDLITDIQDKKRDNWKTIIVTKKFTELSNILTEKKVIFGVDKDYFLENDNGTLVLPLNNEQGYPLSFQTPREKILFITDKDIAFLDKKDTPTKNNQSVYLDLLTSLKYNNLVVHADHGVARFLGLEKKTVDEITKEYLRLGYAENDKLFVPVDQADKVSKYIGAEELAPKLTRLGSAEWATVTRRIKAETQKIAKELLKLYAARKAAKGIKFKKDTPEQELFEKSFKYEPTPGQIKAILDVKKDMESDLPMDRLICGDVGFGKTEVAMRAAFKAAKSGKQVAFIAPVTILADQHYHSFKKRMDKFHVRTEMISRFKTKSEQKEILEKLSKGEIDIIIGTHRLIQPDVKFKDLGLLIIDEEQRFGVKQKEKLKELRTEVDVLTLTATPIPRTLNISLNKLRDITTITTPPPGRLPIITEVRKYSDVLIREAVQKELERDGQVYFLHNKVQTIDSMGEKLAQMIPGAKVIVAHGQLQPQELEKRIIAFKNKEFNILVSSTIIENGIDLSNANTLIVNNAEKFGLSQLYQLRGRVGRSKTQAYAYFLYHGQRLKLDAKKRLRAIVEASELGSGFQIAMKDLEIRGAGEILGASQSGAMNVVGASHFMRMLNKAVEELESGGSQDDETLQDIAIELPINAYIPDTYIPNAKDKIAFYQKLSAADTVDYLYEIQEDLIQEFGKLPIEVDNLCRIIELKIHTKKANLTNVKAQSSHLSKVGKVIILTMSNKVKPENIACLLEYNSDWQITGNKLRIAIEDLGAHWFNPLLESVIALSKSKKLPAPSKVKV